MYNLELFVIAIYCFISEDLYPEYCRRNGKLRRSGPTPALSDAECLTIEIVGQYLGYHTQKQLYEQMHERFGTWFPALKDRPAFVRQSANLWQVKAWMQQHLVTRLCGHQAQVQIIDTLPLPICKLARRKRRKIFRTDAIFEFPRPTKGYCAAKKEDYFGFKGGLRITDYGLIVQAPIVQAYGHDSQARETLLWGIAPGSLALTDVAFMDLKWQKLCQQTYHLRVLTPFKSNMKPNSDRMPFKLSSAGNALRRLIETVYAQLTERFQVTRMKVRDAWHLQNLWNTKILTHTICVFFNIRFKRNPLDFEGLVCF
jgi:hypothetical protein